MKHSFSTRLVLLGSFLSGAALAEPVWRGDFETGDFSQWSFELNPEGLAVVGDPVLEGSNAGRVVITDQNLWSNGLNRVELQHKLAAGRGDPGTSTYFGWSVYLPQALTAADHQLGYWETNSTFRQVLSLHARGTELSLRTNQPSRTIWTGSDRLTPGRWHRFVYYLQWAEEPTAGAVSLWVDGEKVVDCIAASTYLGNPAFIQVGILRDTIATQETLLLDAALEGDSYADVALAESLPNAPGEDPASVVGCTGAPTSPSPATPSPAPGNGPSGGSSDSNQSARSSDDDSGCAMAPGRPSESGHWAPWLALICFTRTRRGNPGGKTKKSDAAEGGGDLWPRREEEVQEPREGGSRAPVRKSDAK